jgi:hypothetical protein
MTSSQLSGAESITLPSQAELEPIKSFLQNALTSKQRGQPQAYNAIIQQFRMKDDPEMLWKVVIALNSFISGILSR